MYLASLYFEWFNATILALPLGNIPSGITTTPTGVPSDEFHSSDDIVLTLDPSQ